MKVLQFLQFWLLLLAFLALSVNVAAHQELSPDELVEYHRIAKRNSEALNRCLQYPDMHEHHARMLVHRDQTLKHIRKTRGIDTEDLTKRDGPAVTKWAGLSHVQESGHSQDPQDLFNFDWDKDPVYNNTGYALTPESIYGPFWEEGQPERADIRAGMRGIYLRLAMQVIDINTCMPLHGARVDIWHANATGDYDSNRNGFLRGWQPTSPHGTVDFDTNFPGHYSYRASHIHVVVRIPNQQRVAHVGQIYFDQWLRDQLERTDFYRTNRKQLTSNLEDNFLPLDASDAFDPFVRWSRIGSSPYDGVLAWITLGVDTTNSAIEQPPTPEGSSQKRNRIDWHLD